MQGPINTLTLNKFIHKFVNSQLSRSLNSVTTLKDAQNLSSRCEKSNQEDKTKIFIGELETNSFLPTVLQEDKVC